MTVSNFFLRRYYHNITANTLVILEAMAAQGVKTLIYSSTCATYGEPEKMPITEETPQVRKSLTKLAYTTLALEKVVLPLSSQCVCFPFLFYGRLSSSKPDKSALLFPGRSVKEFVEACKKATGVNIKVDYLDRRPGDYAEVYSDPSKINSELNWTARYTDLQESLSVAWRWQKSHPNGYGSPSAMAV
ncbi:hypothetical protein BHE74_00047352 [Ensete ventricosum]|nr:hypothetical protein BHE74_00047352 [Ensete ventricosum]